MKKISVLILSVFALLTCERDDICPESSPTTPKLIIRFYDSENPTETKSVTSLTIIGEGNEERIITTTTTDSITIPLKTFDTNTKFSFYKDSEIDEDDMILGNGDDIIFTYNPEDVYVSRACGYKTIFNDVNSDLEDDGDNWIINILKLEDPLTVDNETAAHIQIFH